MKFPSIIKTAKHNRFNFDPRYYDPIKEEIDEKLKAAKAKKGEMSSEFRNSNISAAFRKRAQKNNQASALQGLIALILIGTMVGWYYLEGDIVYVLMLGFPLYLFFRLRKKGKRE